MKRQTFPIAVLFTLLAVMAIFATTVSADQKESVLYRFKGQPDGAIPTASLVADAAHNLYGTTAVGGSAGYGTVFEISPPGTAWSETVLYNFAGNNDGQYPSSNLIFDKAGNLYGTTYGGGGTANCTSGCGTVFELTPPVVQGSPWTETILYAFQGLTDGANPVAGLIMDGKGNLYGTTYYGGGAECQFCGTAFELTPPATQGAPWTETLLHVFGKGSDGMNPAAGLTFGINGAIFGTTMTGKGSAKAGMVFKLKPPATQGGPWSEGVIYRFTGSTDGGAPAAALIIDRSGNLYGTTSAGGQSFGVVFEIAQGTVSETVLYNFTGGNDGAKPAARLLIDKSGNLYGTTSSGGEKNNGSVFELTPPASQGNPWTEQTLYDFTGGHDGSKPLAGLTFGKGGQVYGTTSSGGASKAGTVFRMII